MFLYTEFDDFKETMQHYFSSSFGVEDLAFVKNVIYNKNWYSSEESSGLCIFRATDDNLYFVEYGYCVMSDNHHPYKPQEISEECAVEKMLEMEASIFEHNAVRILGYS